MKVLVLNCGSSSIKYQLLDMANDAEVLAIGIAERIGMEGSFVKFEGKEKIKELHEIPNHTVGIELILKLLVDPAKGVIGDVTEINAVGHRVAHGGENFTASALVTDKVKKDIEACIPLAPLHNPANLSGITSMEAILPGVPQVAVFDTSFHQTMPAHAYLYGVDYKYYEQYKVRRYGFHGTSHKFVAEKASQMLGKEMADLNIITCHLGNGASIAAIQKGKSVDTSMGFTPVEGLMMGTRAGDLDLGVLLYLMEKEGLDLKGANNLINKESGMNAVSGVSSDMRDVTEAMNSGNKRAKEALSMYAYRVKKYIGSYAAAMGGVDLIVFTGGIGENDDYIRQEVCKGLEFLGVDFDFELNKGLRGKDTVLTKEGSRTKIMLVTTNEELVIATDTLRIVNEA